MMIWLEAISQLQGGGTLSHKGLELSPEPDGGYLLRDADGREEGHTVMLDALDAFTSRIGERGLRQAVAASRYQHLFPSGSSLCWQQEPLQRWTPDQGDTPRLQQRVGNGHTRGAPPWQVACWDGARRDSAGTGGVADEFHREPARAAGG